MAEKGTVSTQILDTAQCPLPISLTQNCASAHQYLSLLGLGVSTDSTSLVERGPSPMAGTAGK
jgi:hypothetical protein